jgi:hypothetical protein
LEDWKLQRNQAEYDVKQMVAQVKSTEVRIAVAQQDLVIHRQTIEQSQAISRYMQSKFTSRELYQWMAGRLSTLYFQTYNLALSAALKAQAAYQFETDNSEQMISFSYWDNLYKGLLAGESLMVSLQQLENTHVQRNRRRFEIEKTISLFNLLKNEPGGPEKLDAFKTSGELEFDFKEPLFTGDYKDIYCLKIKTVSISIPAVVGPYENVHATLTQTKNTVFTDKAGNVKRENWVPNQVIAISDGVNDSGMFSLDFNDDKYLPFEGTGAISSWKFSMLPELNKTIKLADIPDVIITLQYTAKR